MIKVVTTCVKNDRVCVAAKSKIGKDVMEIINRCTVLKVTDKGYFFDARLKAELERYFGLEDKADEEI